MNIVSIRATLAFKTMPVVVFVLGLGMAAAAGLLSHREFDTGKLGVPQAILRKPGPLDAHEWVVMRTHPQVGFDILNKSSAPVFQLAAEVSLCHHEKWDGSGYPAGLKGQAIPQSALIVALADVFDALSMKRPYKEPWPLDKIMAHLAAGSGVHFDPELVTVFMSILPEILAIQGCWDDAELKNDGS